MLNGKLIGVVVPAYNEESQIGKVIETMPLFVDRIIIMNDCSKDKTSKVVESYIDNSKYGESEVIIECFDYHLQSSLNPELNFYINSNPSRKDYSSNRVILMNNAKNEGNGKSISRGLKFALDLGLDAVSIMDGDGQMDPNELESVVGPIVFNGVDYTKGNRLIHPSAKYVIPKIRYFGNSALSIMNKVASGYWKISDTQTGYVGLSKKALDSIELHSMYKRYGWPNDLLIKANIENCTIREVEIKPVYNVGENSKMKIFKVIPKISWLLIKSFFKRIYKKYLYRRFHPIFLLYHFAFLLGLLDLAYIYDVMKVIFGDADISFENLLIFSFISIAGFQSFLFAMWMDIQDNEKLYK